MPFDQDLIGISMDFDDLLTTLFLMSQSQFSMEKSSLSGYTIYTCDYLQ